MLKDAPITNPEITAVFLDVDGTLLELADGPDEVEVTPGLPAGLAALRDRLGGALALISGRTLATLDGLFDTVELAAAGTHGLEVRGAGAGDETGGLPPIPDSVRSQLVELAATDDGFLLEDKDLCLAFHFRRRPDRETFVRTRFEALLQELGDRFELQHGKMVVELKPTGINKGTAIQTFMGGPPFAGRQPLFIGDDVTDEAGFSAVNRMGGLSIRVGRRDARTEAEYYLRDVPAVHAWIRSMSRPLTEKEN